MKSFSFAIILFVLNGVIGQQDQTLFDLKEQIDNEFNRGIDTMTADEIMDNHFEHLFDIPEDSDIQDDDDEVDDVDDDEDDDDDDEIDYDNDELKSLYDMLLKLNDDKTVDFPNMGVFPPIIENIPNSAAPSNEQPHDVFITNVELNMVIYGSDQNEKRDDQPLNFIVDDSYSKDNQTGMLLNFNLNLSEERTFLALAILGIIISSVCVTIFLARLQRKRLDSMSAVPSTSIDEQLYKNYQLMDTKSMEEGRTDFKLFGK